MTKEQLGEFTRRITQTNRTGLVVIIFEILDQYLEDAGQALELDKLDDYVFNIRKARQFLNQLMNSLDFQYPIARQLLNVYRFAEECLIKCELRRKDVHLQLTRETLADIRKAFEEVAKQDSSGMVMRNTQSVYEGLTYGRDGRNRVDVMEMERYRNGSNLYQ